MNPAHPSTRAIDSSPLRHSTPSLFRWRSMSRSAARLLAGTMAVAALAGEVSAQVIFSDDFESGNLNNWTSTGTNPLEISTVTNRIPAGGAQSAYLNTSIDRMHRNMIADNGGAELGGNIVMTSWIYDQGTNSGSVGATRLFNEMRGYSAGTGLPNGGTTASGALAQLLAVGKFNSTTLPGDTFTTTKYQGRVAFGPGTGGSTGWFNLNGPGSPNRSIGWHRFDIEVAADGTTIRFYVDGILSRTFTGADAVTYDTLIMGPGLGSQLGDAWIDGFVITVGVPVITTQPQGKIANAGGSVTFSAEAAGGLTFQWKHNGSDIGGATSASYTIPNVSGANAGTYSVVIGNSAGSTTSSEVTLTVLPGITSQPANQTNCVGSTASFSVTAGGEAPLAYQWYLNEATALTDETNAVLTLANVQSSQAGNYSVVVTNNSGSVTSTLAILVVNANPTVSVNSGVICVGASATLTATTATANPAYLWTPGGETTPSITVSPTATTLYSVTVTETSTGCSVSGSGTVTVNPLPTVTVNSEAICAGATATLTATTGAADPSYLWTPGGATTASIMVSPTETTLYSVLVTDGITTCSSSASGTVTVTPVPTVSVNSETVCAGSSATLTATTSAANPNYLWTPGGATTASITVSPTETTIYTVSVTDGAANCPKTAAGTVTVTPVAPVSVNSETICAGASAILTATTTAANPTYLWSPGGEITAAISVSPTMTTNYTVTVTDGTTACTATGTGTVTVNPLPTVTVNSGTICPGGSVMLTATTAAANPTYLWTPGGETTASITVSPASTTAYSVTVTDGTTTCSRTASGTVTVTDVPTVAVNSPTICVGGTAILTATTSAGSPTYLWAPGGETTASISVSPASTTAYTVTVTDGGSVSCQNSAVGTVTVNPLPTVSVNSETVCAGGSATLTATTSAANPSYLWSPGGATTASIDVTPQSTTLYTVTVTDGGTTCSASSSGTVTVNPLPTVTVNSPTICLGDSAVLTATTSAANPTYLWSPGGETTASITVTPLSTTTYSVAVTDGATTCSSSGSGTVTVKTPQVFANTAAITINDANTASPYPAVINVAGLTATVCKVTVTLNNLSHDFADDIDMILVGPNGEGVLLMSDVGGGNAIAGANLTFDDTASSSLPDSGAISSGIFKPTNFGAKSDGLSDLFPAPAPTTRYTTNLGSFSGINPNGAWSLLIVDDDVVDAGAVAGGWSIALTTQVPFADVAVAQATSPSPVATGSNLTYTVTVTNLGPADAASVVLTDTLPAGVVFVSASSTQGSCSETAGVITCSVGTVAPGAAVTATIIVVSGNTGTLLNSATVASTTLDFISVNNSSSASVTVLTPPSITVSPTNQIACVGGAASFSVEATGDAPLGYQWYHDDVAIPGATAATLTLPGVQLTDGGTYKIVVNNSVGAVQASATLTVNPNPVVTVNSETICFGTSATLTAAHNAANPTFVWSPGGATSSSITVSPASTTIYTVTVTDGVTGCSSSASGTVTINPLTVATALQSFSSLCPGSPVTFSTTASGTEPFTYVWRKDGALIAGETGASFSIAAVTAADAGTYTVEVTGGCSSVTNSGSLSVVGEPVITAQPLNLTAPMGNGTVFSITATAAVTPTYQWQLNGTDIPGATASSLAVSNLVLSQTGEAYRAIVTTCAGSVTSAVATLTVIPVSGISFDFDTPGQFTNTPYYLAFNDWLFSSAGVLPSVTFEVPTGGVGPAPGSGALDLINGNNQENSITLWGQPFDFSLPGKTLVASVMFKAKAPAQNNRSTQIGFLTATNIGINDTSPQGFMTAILQSTAQPALTYGTRFQHRLTTGSITEVTPAATTAGLTAGNWYKVNATFVNLKGTAANTISVAMSVTDMGPLGTTPGAVVLSYAPTNFVNATMANAPAVYLAMRGFENTGVDFRDNIHVYTTNGPVFFVTPPANQTVLQGRRATFKAYADGEGPYTYQWNKNGVPIPGARNWKYVTPVTSLSDNGAQYSVTVTGPANSVTSDAGILTVQPDPLDLVSVGSVDGAVIGVQFDQAVDQASAENPANYSINGQPATGARLHFTNLGAQGQDGVRVLITPAGQLTSPYVVVVQNVQDRSGGVIGANNTASGRVEGLTGYDINPLVIQPPGANYSFAPGQFDISGGGADIFGTADSFRYVYTTRTGDFDVKMRVTALDAVRTPTKAGFEVRASLDPTSPQVLAAVNPSFPGRNFTEGTVRQTYNVATTSWGNGQVFGAGYPNVWLRMRRVGNTFMRYSSTNGINWLFDGQFSPSPAMPDTVFFGLAVCAVANANICSAQMDNYGDFTGYPGSTINIVQQPANVTTNAGSAAQITAVATLTGGGAPGAAGELSYIWQRSNGAGGWTNMPTAGATNNILSTGPLLFSDSGAEYRVIVSAPNAASVTSSTATVTVLDTVAPTMTGAVIPTNAVRQVFLTYSENMSASAIATGNYVVTNAAGADMGVASAIFLHGDPRSVLLTTVEPLTLGNYGVRATGVQDLNGNLLNPNPTIRTFSQIGTAPLAPVVVEYFTGLSNAPADITTLTSQLRFTSDNPDFIVYSNVFGINPLNANFPDPLNNYGVRMYTYFVAPSSGAFKFYVRADDFAEFWMNTNAANSTTRTGATLQRALTGNSQVYTLANSVTNTLVAGQRYYMELRFKETTGGDGGTVAVRTDNTVPGQGEVIPGAQCAFPDAIARPTPVAVELYTGMATVGSGVANGSLPDLLAATNTLNFILRTPNVVGYERYFGFITNMFQGNAATFDNYLGRMYAYFIPPTTGLYKFWVRSDDSSQIWMNTNAVNSTDPAGISLLGQLTAFTGNYTLVAQNVSLVGGQRYYIEGRWRDGTGGDGMNMTVRSQSDATTPPNTEVAQGNLFEFPTNLARIGPVSLAGLTPVNPVVSDGQVITFIPHGVNGALPYGVVWFKNGQQIAANVTTLTTQPLTVADNGAIFTVVVTNLFSRAEASSTVTVLGDNTPPTIATVTSSQYGDYLVVTFSEPVDITTAGALGNYAVDQGLRLLSATFDTVTRNRVIIRTSPLAPATTYLLSVSGVRDASSSGNLMASTTVPFSTWGAGGAGFYVELFTNIAGTAVANLTNDVKFINNLPDVTYYTNVFGIGGFQADSGLNNFGGRISGFFTPTNTGLFRFYVRGDDGTMLFMNTNGSSPSGRVMIARNDGANSSAYDNGTGGSASPILSLQEGVSYYIEALMKEGGGGDHLEVAWRQIDPGTLTAIGGVPPTTEIAGAGNVFSAPGNPDAVRLVVSSAPPVELSVIESDQVNLGVVGTLLPPSVARAVIYRWQKFDAAGGVYTNIPGALGPAISFRASLEDDGAQFRLTVALPGTNAIFNTLLHVAPDVTPPVITSVSSIDGYRIGIRFNEQVLESTAVDTFNYFVNGGANVVLQAEHRLDRSSVVLTLEAPVSGTFDVFVENMQDVAVAGNFGPSSASGRVQGYQPMDLGAPTAVGSSFTSKEGEIDVIAGGADIWGAADQGHFTLKPRYGDFDIHTRIQSLAPRSAAPDIAKAGLVIRESTNANSRTLTHLVNPPLALGGRDQGEAGQRINTGSGTALVPGSAAYIPVGIPNAWVRIKRTGDLYTTYRSSDGINWITVGSTVLPLGEQVFLGLGTTAHNNAAPATLAEYRNIYIPEIPTILTQPAPATQTIALGGSVTYSVVASNPPNSGPLVYQWKKNGTAIAGATGDTLTLNGLQASQAGVYTVWVGNDGGAAISSNAELVVANLQPVVVNDSLTTQQDVAVTTSAANLLANDSDPEGSALSVIGVSGLAPASYASDFNNGLPAGALVYGVTSVEAAGGVGDSGYLRITPGLGGQSGAFILEELTPGRRISAFSASFKLRIAEGSTEPADGFSFNFASDLPLATSTGAESGLGTGLSWTVDNYQFAGVANTSGMKLRFGGVDVASVRIPTWDKNVFVPVSITLSYGGVVTVMIDGTNAFGNIQLNYTPRIGRFGFYARTGGQYQSHSLDDLSITTALTVETAREQTFGGRFFGSAYTDGVLHLTDAANNQAGSFIVNELTPGIPVTSFTASFGVQIGSGSADGADGLSLNFAADLPNAAVTGAEDGVGTGLSICIDNYSGGTTPAGPAIRVKYAGTFLSSVQVPKWNNPNFIPMTVKLDADGTVDVIVNGTNVFDNLPTPYTPTAGRFGLYARTGGLNQRHWIDDLNINAATAGSPGTFAATFPGVRFSTVVMTNNVIAYSPASGICGSDRYYYLVSDGQGGVSVGTVTVNIDRTTPTAPVITQCVGPQTVQSGANCQIALPDFTGLIRADDCGILTITQSPAPGTLVGLGTHSVTFTVSNDVALTATCQTSVTVVDTAPPQIVACASAPVIAAGANCSAILPDLRAELIFTDSCAVTVTQTPAPGTVVPLGTTAITLTATDANNNSTNCIVLATVIDSTAPVINCPANIAAQCGGPNGAVVNFTVTALDNCDPNPVITTVPASGSTFPVGTNLVTATAVDAAGNTNICTFTVTVESPVIPALTIARSGSESLLLSWPVSCATYILEETIDLNTGTWSPTSGAVTIVGGNNQVTQPVAAGNKFYRLIKQP